MAAVQLGGTWRHGMESTHTSQALYQNSEASPYSEDPDAMLSDEVATTVLRNCGFDPNDLHASLDEKDDTAWHLAGRVQRLGVRMAKWLEANGAADMINTSTFGTTRPPSTIDHRPSTIDHRPSTIDHCPVPSTRLPSTLPRYPPTLQVPLPE